MLKKRSFLLLVANGLAGMFCLLAVRAGGASGAARQPADPGVGINGEACSYFTIGEALGAAAPGDVIFISTGTYNERLGRINMDLTLTAGSEDCTQAADPPQYAVDIDANDLGAAFGGVIELAATHTLTLTNLYLSDGSASYGGLLYVHSGSTVILDDTDLGYGSASQFGGGIRARGTVEFRNGSMLFSSRATGSGNGGGVSLVAGGRLIMRDGSTVGFCGPGFENVAGEDGGGVYLDGGLLEMYGTSRICSNTASRNGGGIYATGSALIYLFDDASIGGLDIPSGNTAQVGAGAYLTGDASLQLAGSATVEFNTAGLDGGGVAVQGYAELLLNGQGATIKDNHAAIHGGGVWVAAHNPGETPRAVLEGGALVEQNAADYGGGLYVEGLGAAARLTDAVIRRNTGILHGGGLQVHNNAAVLIFGSLIEENEATTYSGGGIAALLGDGVSITLTLSNTVLLSNSAGTDGGGIMVDSGTLSLNNMIVRGNTAGHRGGGLAAIDGSDVFGTATMSVPVQQAEFIKINAPCDPAALPPDTYCAEFRDNQAGDAGGAIYVDTGSTLEVGHTAFVANQAGTVGGAVYSGGTDDVVSLRNSLFRGNSGGNVVRVFFGSLLAENNTFAGNPAAAVSLGWANPPAVLVNNVIWENADGVVTNGAAVNATCSISQNGVGGQIRDPVLITSARGAYHLSRGSDAVDVCTDGPAVDLDNLSRPVSSLWDMGAFERVEYLPVAVADTYTMTQGTALVIPAPGVLNNDQDANGDPLTVALEIDPDHGSITLAPVGSFTYTPAEEFLGEDQFTYTVTDGLDSVSSIVVIHIVEGPEPVYLPAIFRSAG